MGEGQDTDNSPNTQMAAGSREKPRFLRPPTPVQLSRSPRCTGLAGAAAAHRPGCLATALRARGVHRPRWSCRARGPASTRRFHCRATRAG